MLARIASAALVIAAATTAYGQHDAGKRLGGPGDPFAISSGTSFSASASSSSKAKRSPSASRTLAASISTDVQDAIAIIRQNHVGGRSNSFNDLSKASINSMLKSLDPHSNYYDPIEWKELLGDQRSEYVGTGSTIVSYERDGRQETYVIATYAGSASEKAGLRFGDRITAVNGTSIEGRSSLEIRDMIRGPRNTSVKVSVDRDGNVLTFDLKRDRIPQPTVTNAFLIGDGVGLIEMPEGFSLTSYNEFDAAFDHLKKAGMTSVIIDLRGNPGGVLETSVKIAEKFLPAGATIVSQRGRFRADNRVWKSSNRSPEKMPVIVLVDGESASASEIIAGALQDNDRALIVGEKTFGKGLVQSVLDLPSGTGLTLTTAKYFTPSGRSIQRDYERSGTYAYYQHEEEEGSKESKVAAYTVTKRQVFGGDGITPDEFAPSQEATENRIALLDPIFFFAKEHRTLTDVSDETVAEFAKFAAEGWGMNEAEVLKDSDFIRVRLQYSLTLGSSGLTSARQQMLTADQQVRKAVNSVTKAAAFTRSRVNRNLSVK